MISPGSDEWTWPVTLEITGNFGALNAMLFANLIPVVTFAIGFAQGYRPLPAEIVGAGMVITAMAAFAYIAFKKGR